VLAAGALVAAGLAFRRRKRRWRGQCRARYWRKAALLLVNPPLTHFQPTLLRRGFLDCTLTIAS